MLFAETQGCGLFVTGSGLETALKILALRRAGRGLNPEATLFRLERGVRFFWAGRFALWAGRFFFGMVLCFGVLLVCPSRTPIVRSCGCFSPWQNSF